MRLWQREFWGVLALLLGVTNAQMTHSTQTHNNIPEDFKLDMTQTEQNLTTSDTQPVLKQEVLTIKQNNTEKQTHQEHVDTRKYLTTLSVENELQLRKENITAGHTHRHPLLSNNNNSHLGQTEQVINVESRNYTDLRSKHVTNHIQVDLNQELIEHNHKTYNYSISNTSDDLDLNVNNENIFNMANQDNSTKPFNSDENNSNLLLNKITLNRNALTVDENGKTTPINKNSNKDLELTVVSNYSNVDRIEQRLALDSEDSWGSLGNKFNAPEAREVEEAADYGLRMMNQLISVREPELYRMGLLLNKDDPASKVASFNAPNHRAVRLSRYGYASLQASTRLVQQLSMAGTEAEMRTTALHMSAELRDSLRGTALHNECPFRGPVPCRPAARRYRTSDGTCNNRQFPKRGSALTAQQRFLRPKYDDGLQTIRRSVLDNSVLPSAREVSTRIHRDRNLEAPSVTLMLMQWGQFIDHDITATPQARAFNGSTPRCCTDGGRAFQPLEFMHPECLPIPVPNDDWFLSRFQIRCLEFVRSAATPREECDFGHRQQMNQVTSFIDASTIYGSSASQSDSIRLFRNGMLQYGRLDNRNPPDPAGGELCRMGAISSQCFRAGDFRSSEQPALTAIHITWIRKHNSLATRLTDLNRHWSDEKIFQETRRIIGAIIQHITYREFLPIILGHEVMKLFDLELVSKGYYTGYDELVNPALANSFTAAAYRFGHSLVPKTFVRSDTLHRPIFNNVSLHDEQTNSGNIWSFGSLDRLLLGMSNQASQRRDEFISEELTNHLFQSPGFPFGMDLAAINIQRGRDHGVPPYTSWRVPCGLSPINNWTDLQRVMSAETAQRFRSLYLSVDDIDLYSAGLAEKPVRGGLVGPTFACIIAQQFANLKKGDRFWYENGKFESSFTPAQLQQIRKSTLSQIICETMNEVDTIQPFVFLTPDDLQNQRKLCRDLIDFDMTPWIENFSDPIDKDNNFELTDSNNVENKSRQTESDIVRIKREDTPNIYQSTVTNIINKTDKLDMNDTLQPIYEQTDNGTTHLTELDFTDPTRTERKRKVQTTRTKPKVKPNRNKKPTILTTTPKSRRSNKTRTTLKHASYLNSYAFTVDRDAQIKRPYQAQHPYYSINDYLSNGQYDDDLTVVIPTKRPKEKPVTYLFNTVQKVATTTPKPDYQLNIQINYFYNTTTESYEYNRPTRPNSNNYNNNRPVTHSYDYSASTRRPIHTNSPNTYNNNEQIPTYNSQNNYNHYVNQGPETYSPNDKIDFGQNQYTTRNPYSTATSHPMTVLDLQQPIYLRPQTVQTKRPSVIINTNHFDQNKLNGGYGIYKPMPNVLQTKPTTFDYEHPTYDQYRPTYNPRPQTIIYKRPVTGEVTKLDTKPFVVYNPEQYYTYGTETKYDNENANIQIDTRPTLHINKNQELAHNLNDKLDFTGSKRFVKIISTKHSISSTAKPIDDRKFVKIATVKGQTTSTNSFDKVYVTLQKKGSEDDLQMTYDDLFEVYTKPDSDVANDHLKQIEQRNDMWKIYNTTSDIESPLMPLRKPNHDLCSTELPKPMHLILDDDLL